MAHSASQTYQYFIRLPGIGLKSFAVIKRLRALKGEKSKNETVVTPTLKSVNERFKAGGYTQAEAREAVEREVDRLRQLAFGGKKINLSDANQRRLQQYWDREYSHRQLVDEKSAWNRLVRAIAALGDTPLEASKDDLQRAVNTSCRNRPNRQRDVVAAINQILKWMGRTDARLVRFKKERRQVKFLTLEDWANVAPIIGDETLRALAWVGITSGCRVGEIFAIDSANWNKDTGSLFVTNQIDRAGKRRATKNGRERLVPLLPASEKWLSRWLDLPIENRRSIRRQRFAEIISRACKKAFPADRDKWLTFHDLRHSYAIHLLNRGVPLGLVAQSLGDTEAVVQENYVGFVLSQPGLHAVLQILNQ